MNVGRTPGIGVVLPGIRPRTNCQEAVAPCFIRQTAAHAQEVRIERPRPLISFVEVPASGIGLPDLQERVGHRMATVVEYATGHNDALADRLATGPGVTCEIGIFRGDGTDGGSGTGQLRERERYLDERRPRSPAPRGLIGLIQVGREHLPLSPHDVAYGDLVHASILLRVFASSPPSTRVYAG